jgi:multidrug resistance efflux pump
MFALLLCVALTVSVSAQGTTAPTAGMKIGSDADYATHMKEIQQQNGMLNKSIKGGMAEEATKAAARLEVLFKNIHGYWNDKKVEDATTASQTAVTSLQAVQKALAANDMTAAETARATFAGTCMTCHTAHREKLPEGGFRIK